MVFAVCKTQYERTYQTRVWNCPNPLEATHVLFLEKYGTPLYGFNKLFLLMEKQHNRGQDGAGIGCTKAEYACRRADYVSGA